MTSTIKDRRYRSETQRRRCPTNQANSRAKEERLASAKEFQNLKDKSSKQIKDLQTTTALRFDLPEVSDVTLTIYNMLGQKVRTFDYQNTSAGYHSVTWDATNDLGQQVGAGVYLYQLQTKNFVKTRKMVLLK